MDNTPFGIAVRRGEDLVYELANPVVSRLFPEKAGGLCGTSWFDLFPEVPPERHVGRQVLRDGVTRRWPEGSFPITQPDGTKQDRYFDTSMIPLRGPDGVPDAVLDIFVDTTEQVLARKRIEALAEERRAALERAQRELEERLKAEEGLRRVQAQLLQAQKMEAVGRLAGGIAHDFNNILSVVLSYAELVLETLPADVAWREPIEEIARAGGRGAALTHQLLAFSRQQVFALRALNLNDVVRDIVPMLRRLLGEDMHIELDLAPKPAVVEMDPTQMQQVIVNLAVNARDAMPSGGTLRITTRTDGSGSGRRVVLVVSDDGTGMSAEVQAHIFEPFFTTKAVGKGTGLGLATVCGIIDQSGATIDVTSAPGAGTMFTITFGAMRDASPPVSFVQPMSIGQGRGRILLVEDDDMVRDANRHVLRHVGYDVIVAADGRRALEVAGEMGEVNLLVTDMIMPGMRGHDLADALRKRWPDLRVLFLSGYTDSELVDPRWLDHQTAFLQKPVTLHVLAAHVRRLLQGE